MNTWAVEVIGSALGHPDETEAEVDSPDLSNWVTWRAKNSKRKTMGL